MRTMDDLTWRALSPTDAAEMAAVGATVAAADRIVGRERTEAEIARSFDSAGRPAPPAAIGAYAADGRLAGYGVLTARTAADPVHLMMFDGMVHPDFRRRGIGTELLLRAVAAAPALHARAFPEAPLELLVNMLDDVPGQLETAAAAGFAPWRGAVEMSRDLPNDPDSLRVPPPAGLEPVGFAPEYVELLRAAHNAAFVPDHPGSTASTPEMWASRFTVPSFRPELSFFLRERGSEEVVGYLLAAELGKSSGSDVRDAHLATIATLRGHRGRGVASALIGAALAEAVRRGYGTASLDVDADNPSGAVRVYERAGFRVVRRATAHIRKIAV
jgi:mycothiol synthase